MLIFVAIFVGTFSGTIACADYWTPWFNRDTADVDDLETANLIYKEHKNQMCEKPTGIECRTVDGAPYWSTKEATTCALYGLICRGYCSDYKVRFLCPATTPPGLKLLSKRPKATQSSLGWGGIPDRAIDGNNDGAYGQKSCTHTQKQADNWWMVDLGNSYMVKLVKIYNRADCCKDRLNGAIIHVGDNANGMLNNAVCGEPIKNDGTNCVFDRHCALKGQYVSVSLKNNYLTLCEVEVWGEDTTSSGLQLLSKGPETTQSSVAWSGIPERAIDGNCAAIYGQKSCTHTKKEADNWWMVNLGKSYMVKEVRILNREDCCKDRLDGATIRVGDDTNGMLTNAVCGDPIKDAATSPVINRKCSLKGQYVSVSLKNEYLTLCEVEVLGEAVARGDGVVKKVLKIG